MMHLKIPEFLRPPVFSDARKDASVRLLYALMLLCLGLMLAFRILHPILADKPKPTYLSVYLIPLAVLVSHILAKRGKLKAAAHFLIGLQWLMIFSIVLREGGVQSIAFSFCMVLIVFSALVLGNLAASIYTILSILVGAVSVLLTDMDLIRPVYKAVSNKGILLGVSIGFIMIAFLMRFAMSGFRKIQEELAEVQRYAQIGGWTFNIRTNEIVLTEEFQYILGEANPKGSKVVSLRKFLDAHVAPEEEQKIVNILQDCIRRKDDPDFSLDVVYEAIRIDGDKRFIHVRGKYKDSNTLFGTSQDITEKFLAQEKLRTNQELFEKIFQLSPYAISISRVKDGRYFDINESFTRLFGYTREDAVGKTALDIGLWVYPEERKKFIEKIMRDGILLNEETFYRTKDGRVLHCEFSTRFALIEGEESMINVVQDTADRKEAEGLRVLNREISEQNLLIAEQKSELESTLLNLRKTQNQLVVSEKMAALGQLVAGIAHEINNPIGVISAANETIRSHFNRSTERMEEAFLILRGLEEKGRDDLYSLLRKGHYHQELLSPKETRKRTKVLETNLKELGIEGAHSLAEELVEAGLENALTDFPGLFAGKHSREVLMYALDEIQAARSCRLIEISVDRTSKIVYALKNFSHFRSEGEKTAVHLYESLETVLTIYHNQLKTGVEIRKNYNELPPIQAYPDDLLHVWTNLVYNAAQAMNFKGVLTLEIHRIGDYEVEVRISDTGPGIPESIAERIFEPFFTTKAQGEGSGLGLDIARRIVENHNGTIRFDTSSSGTKFFIRLPMGG
ncbi:PAS domain-containing sensor histidine kinase [Leptospira fluminis]|uniref:histidine kinase n=2 Tax=Leptospira fluminis TaxID=2484979 RepID=A0A4R9GRX4_9LEPT|nr:PAS domain-containing sensor histidine kinase [Leptospira fluminis]